MIVKIPEDIYSFKSRFGNFTGRQIISVAIAIAVLALCMVLLLGKMDTRAASIIAALVSAGILACGFFERYGQFFDRIILYKLRWLFGAPRKRSFHASNLYEDIEEYQKEAAEIASRLQMEKKTAKKKAIKNFCFKKGHRSEKYPL